MGNAMTLNDGDIYFWSWKEGMEPRLMGSSDYSYHCRSRIAVVKNGLLIDTFWHGLHSDNALNPDRLNLEFKGNETTLRKINDWETDYYDPEDIVDMRHSNATNAPVYVQAHARRSSTRLLEYLTYKHERAVSAIKSTERDIERIDDALKRVRDGNLEGSFP